MSNHTKGGSPNDRPEKVSLEEIKRELEADWFAGLPRNAEAYIAWLVKKVEGLQSELAYLRDHPGGVDPQTGSQK